MMEHIKLGRMQRKALRQKEIIPADRHRLMSKVTHKVVIYATDICCPHWLWNHYEAEKGLNSWLYLRVLWLCACATHQASLEKLILLRRKKVMKQIRIPLTCKAQVNGMGPDKTNTLGSYCLGSDLGADSGHTDLLFLWIMKEEEMSIHAK